MKSNGFGLEVCVHGKPIREYTHNNRIYVEGRRKSEFTIRVKNPTGCRVLAVPSVDGLSVMDGEECTFDSSGYILDPHSTLVIPGWRLDDEAVAKFTFYNKGGASYAESQGKPQNLGVIGCAFFVEMPKFMFTANTFDFSSNKFNYHSMPIGSTTPANVQVTYGGTANDLKTRCVDYNPVTQTVTDLTSHSTADTEASTVLHSSAPDFDLGTGFGDKHEFVVTSTDFARASTTPLAVLEIHYASKKALKEAGVVLSKPKAKAYIPKAFSTGCKPPKGWEG